MVNLIIHTYLLGPSPTRHIGHIPYAYWNIFLYPSVKCPTWVLNKFRIVHRSYAYSQPIVGF